MVETTSCGVSNELVVQLEKLKHCLGLGSRTSLVGYSNLTGMMPSTSAQHSRFSSNDLSFSRFIRYFVLPFELRKTIWEGTKLQRQTVRKHVFDYDDFVIKAKDAVSSWARDRLRVDVSLISVHVSETHFT